MTTIIIIITENGRNVDNYVSRRGKTVSPYALVHCYVDRLLGDLPRISLEVRTKMRAILFCVGSLISFLQRRRCLHVLALIDQQGMWDSLTLSDTEMPFRDPQVCENFGIPLIP
jgi:hypothetical protein